MSAHRLSNQSLRTAVPKLLSILWTTHQPGYVTSHGPLPLLGWVTEFLIFYYLIWLPKDPASGNALISERKSSVFRTPHWLASLMIIRKFSAEMRPSCPVELREPEKPSPLNEQKQFERWLLIGILLFLLSGAPNMVFLGSGATWSEHLVQICWDPSSLSN